jgi:hypothetical protein
MKQAKKGSSVAGKMLKNPKSSEKKPKPTEGVKRISVEIDKDISVTARQIENGFIISESGYKGAGKNMKYYNKEVFSKDNPIMMKAMPSGVKQPKFGKRG